MLNKMAIVVYQLIILNLVILPIIHAVNTSAIKRIQKRHRLLLNELNS